MEKIRFGKRLLFTMEGLNSLPENSPELPVMILQPLVENAVKHGALRNLEGGSITIAVNAFDDHIELSVQDDGKSELIQPKEIAGAGTAVANCRTRLDLLYRGKASISHQSIAGQGTKVVVSIPFFTQGAQ